MLAGGLFLIASASIFVRAQQAVPDLILTNGKIITVDERFTIAQAVAVRGDRVVAVGTNAEISQLAGSVTKRIDLRGKAVVPGLIDNHSHFMRAGETWTEEVRLDGVESRKQAIEMLDVKPNQKPEDWVQLGRILREIAKARLPLHVHTTLTATAVHARPTILGGVFNEIHGERAYDMPPLKLVQDSGITWGFGTDTTVVDQFRPFTTLYWAVTGKMVGGTKVLRQTISREDALIAHTRKNAYFHFQENNLGSIQPGKMADMLVLDRDYLTIPADQIKDIRPAMTMVGGRIVYDAAATQTSSR